MQHHKYSITELENMIPWEKEIYISLLQQYIEEENLKRQQKGSGNLKFSKDKLFNLQSNPNLDAADTGVDPVTGRYLNNKERRAIFKTKKNKCK